ncbi:polysaccharide biosynthesis protein [Tianweitania sediminis]|uniref:Polysaccharide biosynthesis protein n=1 Tax=Tianweitania sediminis TaxID=1502156 RepID=A0A8J7RMT8_9HYPH|nr:nucleoside-diphosphate sugar epimerase/dehydratase [Tianweitania sediminis]MBP0438639.1 polysaccharide biosynthesis protein [Tianweitania sediminis]
MNLYGYARDHGLLRYVSIAHDLIVAIAAAYLAYLTAYGPVTAYYVPDLFERILLFAAVAMASFALFSVSSGSWRYVSIPDLLAIIKASVTAVVAYTLGSFLVSRGLYLPRSVPILSLIYLVGGLAGPRLAYRLIVERSMFGEPMIGRLSERKRYILLFGMSDAAESFIRSARRNPGRGVAVVGLLDEQRSNLGRKVQGVKVLGNLAALPGVHALLKRRGVEVTELLITEKGVDRTRLGEIVEAATTHGITVSRIPGPDERAEVRGDGAMERKPIELGDLLGRPEVQTDLEGMTRLLNNKVVFVTGAGGSIGSEVCRQIAHFAPRLLVATDNSEFHLFKLDLELGDRFPGLQVISRIMDIRDKGRVAHLFEEYRPDIVFHAAALKHVPFVEDNPLEGIKTNLLGTRNIADAALRLSASTFVMISTDKAVNPTNIMGTTKRAAEAYCQALDIASATTRFKTVRFGNVLGSNGSVVPRFQEQIAKGGPVTVTHPHIIRYFMTIPEAVRLVLHASAHALRHRTERGKIMVLDMGKPVRIVDLAERLIQLAGLKPRVDIEISYTGLRPGEKLYEELFDPSEVQNERTQDGYVMAAPRIIDKALLTRSIDEIEVAASKEDSGKALQLLLHIVPEYRADSGDRAPLTAPLDATPEADKR